jgi:integrase/recombinase XerC
MSDTLLPLVTDPAREDILTLLLADKRSENTKRAYRADIQDFFTAMYGAEPTPTHLAAFLAMGSERVAFLVASYKGDLISRRLSEATVNRRLSAVRSLLLFARRLGLTDADLHRLVPGEKVLAYRDTRGVTMEEARRLLVQPDRTILRGKRDFAMLLLLLENALRSAEVRTLTVADFLPAENALYITGKGRGTQKERVTLNHHTTQAIADYLSQTPHQQVMDAPLFQNLDQRSKGGTLSGWGLHKIVSGYAAAAGITRTLSPHRLRHTAITAALEATQGDVVQVQKLSRHARVETVMRYNDNRQDQQGRVTALLGALFQEPVADEPDPPTDSIECASSVCSDKGL